MGLVDTVTLEITAGDGGDGLVHFLREKFRPKGGPDGGDGGDGGSIYIVGTVHRQTLAHLTGKKRVKADSGVQGGTNRKSGAKGEDQLIEVPVGTEIIDAESKKMLVDINKPEQRVKIAAGGKGGRGNWHFKSATNQAPRKFEPGTKGEVLTITLSLKLIADVGLVGLPNAGKSTLINVLTNTQVKTASYPFTTTEPHLGVLRTPEREVVIADIPGLIAGAAEGRGLGLKFLKHIDRTKVLLHVIAADQENIIEAYQQIQAEMAKYSHNLLQKPMLIVINKSDLVSAGQLKKTVASLKKKTKAPVIVISALTRTNIKELVGEILQLLTSKTN